MRTHTVVGNWKMNNSFEEADNLIFEISTFLKENPQHKKEIIICPPAVYLELATDQAEDCNLLVGAQNLSQFDRGAYTGEISAAMLRSMGVDFCIIGHSERRKYFHESHEVLAQKVEAALKEEIIPIFCCGELLPDREAGNHFEVVKKQLEESLFHLNADDFNSVIVAYEPVWAIGTGVTASPQHAQEMHGYIRQLINEKYDFEVADDASLLYGGSCNAKNARELFSQEDVDGGLIGGASLKADEFIKIIQSF